MDNHSSTKAYSVANPTEFKMEVISLMKKIRNQIDMESSDVSANQSPPNRHSATQLGLLKVHEFKLKEMLEFLENIDDTQWIEFKQDLSNDFEAAYQVFHPAVVK